MVLQKAWIAWKEQAKSNQRKSAYQEITACLMFKSFALCKF